MPYGKESRYLGKLNTRDYIAEALDQHELAILQLEETHKSIPDWIDKKLKTIRNSMYNDGGSYEGAFECEEDARMFGLLVLSRTHKEGSIRQRAHELYERDNIYARDASTGVLSDGGALFGPTFSDRFKRLVEAHGVFTRNAYYMSMPSDSLTFLKQNGEVEVYLLSEGIKGTDSEPNFQRVTLQSKEMGTLTYYPVILSEDAAAVGELVMRSIVWAFAKKFDQLGFNGDGSSGSFGIQGIIPKLKKINGVNDGGSLILGSGNAWSELTLLDHQKVMGQFPNYENAVDPKWYVSRRYWFTVMQPLAVGAGGASAADVINGTEKRFLGEPVEIVSVMPSTEGNSQICALYGDMSLAATWGDRRMVTIQESADYKFAERQVTVLGTARAAIIVEDLGTDTEAGPMIGLITQSG